MSQDFQPGDFLVFQLEAGFALIRLLAVDAAVDAKVWHVAAYGDFFPDVDSAEAATAFPAALTVLNDHMPLTDRAFESTQVARISNVPLTDRELRSLSAWRSGPNGKVSDRSVRLMMGFR